MLNSEKMVASIQSQDLEHANKYFKRALKEDDAETLLELAEYLESIGFLPQAKEIYLQEREDYPSSTINSSSYKPLTALYQSKISLTTTLIEA